MQTVDEERHGRFYRLHVQPTAPPRAPLREGIPVYMAGVNARMIEAAGAVADGLVGHPLFTPEYVREVVRPALARGAERAGRAAPPPLAGYLTCSVAPDPFPEWPFAFHPDQARQVPFRRTEFGL